MRGQTLERGDRPNEREAMVDPGGGQGARENQMPIRGLPLPEVPMADTSQEPHRVNVEDASAAAYWARRFQVPVEDVKAAVQRAGDRPAAVAAELGKPWPYEASGIV